MILTALTAPTAVSAETPRAEGALVTYRELTRTTPPRSNCAAARNTSEVVVCARRQQNLRYRLPLPRSDPEREAATNVRSERFALSGYRLEGGSGSCSTVGPNGVMGCLSMAMRADEEAGDRPGLITRVLTYLDPDE